MNTLDRSSFHDATHVAFDTATTEHLLQIGATNVVHEHDRLILGPSRRDVLEHARARQAWWNSPEKWDRLYSPEVRWNPPVVVWVSTNLHERVNLWRTCSRLRHQGLAGGDSLILEFDPVDRSRTRNPKESRAPFDCTASVSHHADEVLLECFDKARPWPRERYDRALSLWDK